MIRYLPIVTNSSAWMPLNQTLAIPQVLTAYWHPLWKVIVTGPRLPQAQLEQVAAQVLAVPQVLLGLLAHKAAQDRAVLQAQQGQLEPAAELVPQVPVVLLVPRAPADQQVLAVSRVLLVLLDQLVLAEPQELPEPVVKLVPQVPAEQAETQAQLAPQVQLDPQVQLVPQDRLAPQAQLLLDQQGPAGGQQVPQVPQVP